MYKRNAVIERRKAARLALASRVPEPRVDNVDGPCLAHAVRRLCACAHCKGLGDKEQMISILIARYHTKCFREKFGFKAVLELPLHSNGKFRLCDLTTYEMRELLNDRAKRSP
jgi:hypothetical protein